MEPFLQGLSRFPGAAPVGRVCCLGHSAEPLGRVQPSVVGMLFLAPLVTFHHLSFKVAFSLLRFKVSFVYTQRSFQ